MAVFIIFFQITNISEIDIIKFPFKTTVTLILLLTAHSSFAINPNLYTFVVTPNRLYLYDIITNFVWLIVAAGGIAVYSDVINNNLQNKNLKASTKTLPINPFQFFYITSCISLLLLGLFGFITKTSWGLFEVSYINTAQEWRFEVVKFALGVVGLLLYFVITDGFSGDLDE